MRERDDLIRTRYCLRRELSDWVSSKKSVGLSLSFPPSNQLKIISAISHASRNAPTISLLSYSAPSLHLEPADLIWSFALVVLRSVELNIVLLLPSCFGSLRISRPRRGSTLGLKIRSGRSCRYAPTAECLLD